MLGAAAAWRLGTDLTARGRWLVVVGAAMTGALLALARLKVRTTATFLRFLGAASVVFVVQFLVLSPASDLVFGAAASTDHDAADALLAASDGQPPPIVVVVLDALPTASLLDGTGHIDADLYPNLSALAGDATWYRNNTTVSAFTYQVVPALLSGRLPGPKTKLPDTAFPDNLFTLFAGTPDIEAVEQITRLCPSDTCARAGGRRCPRCSATPSTGGAAPLRPTATGPRSCPAPSSPSRATTSPLDRRAGLLARGPARAVVLSPGHAARAVGRAG